MNPLNALQINKTMRKYSDFIGVFAADTLPHIVKRPCGLIVNTDPQQHPGTHWIAIYINKRQQGEYFDTYGLPPMVQHHLDFLNRHCTSWHHNIKTMQSPFSTVCGHYCMLYLDHKFRKKSLNTFVAKTQRNLDSNDAQTYLSFVKKFGKLPKLHNHTQSCTCIKDKAKHENPHSTINREHGRNVARDVVRPERGAKQSRRRGSRQLHRL